MRLAIGGGIAMPGTGTMPTAAPTTMRWPVISWIRWPGASTPSSVQNVTCSSPSTPAATASAIALTAWACAVSSSPSRCASSTAARSTSDGNWARSWREPGVRFPPLAMILMTSTPRMLVHCGLHVLDGRRRGSA